MKWIEKTTITKCFDIFFFTYAFYLTVSIEFSWFTYAAIAVIGILTVWTDIITWSCNSIGSHEFDLVFKIFWITKMFFYRICTIYFVWHFDRHHGRILEHELMRNAIKKIYNVVNLMCFLCICVCSWYFLFDFYSQTATRRTTVTKQKASLSKSINVWNQCFHGIDQFCTCQLFSMHFEWMWQIYARLWI